MSRAVEELTINIDGACSGNPGDASIGVVIRDAAGGFEEKISRYIGKTTNNVAEYSALLAALRRAQELGARVVYVRSDSELLIRQWNGQYQVKNEQLKTLYVEAMRLGKKFERVCAEHVRREFNKEADQLAKAAITNYRRVNRTAAAPSFSGAEESPSSTGQRSG